MDARSLGACACLGDDAALARHAPGGRARARYQRHRLSLRARAPEQHYRTPSTAISAHARFEPCEAVVGMRWTHAHSERVRVVATTRLWRATLLAAGRALGTSGVGFVFVLAPLSITTARLQQPSPHTPCEAVVGMRWTHAHSERVRVLATTRLWHATLLAAERALGTSGVSSPFVLAPLSNTTARLQQPFLHTPDLSRARPWWACDGHTLTRSVCVSWRQRDFGTPRSWRPGAR